VGVARKNLKYLLKISRKGENMLFVYLFMDYLNTLWLVKNYTATNGRVISE
jgi:hypothetical protein